MLLRLARLGGVARRLATSPAGLTTIGCTVAAQPYLQQEYGTASNFFTHSFVTDKEADAVVDFYSTEDFLQILGIFPFAIHFILAGVTWDTKVEQSMDVWNAMQISFTISEEEEILGPDGAPTVVKFCKRERFVNYVPLTKVILWDQVQDYGFRRKSDGRLEVTHVGESFQGPWPVRLAVQLHAMYVIWATEKHINSPLFGTKDLEAQHDQRANIPAYVFNSFITQLKEGQLAAISSQAGGATAEQASTLKQLEKLEKRKDSVGAVNRASRILQRRTTRLDLSDPDAQEAIQQAMKTLAKVKGGEAATQALEKMVNNSAVKWDVKSTAKA